MQSACPLESGRSGSGGTCRFFEWKRSLCSHVSLSLSKGFGRVALSPSYTPSSSSQRVNVSIYLDGPMFRRCDQPGTGAGSSACGWGTTVPIDNQNFERSLRLDSRTNRTVMVMRDTLTNATGASAVWAECGSSATPTEGTVSLSPTGTSQPAPGFLASMPIDETCLLWHAVSAGSDPDEAVELIEEMMLNAQANFDKACSDWKSHWASAFDPNTTSFSGSLPTMEAPDSSASNEKLVQLYEWAATALISLERIGWPSFPRQFVISEGPSNSFSGAADMGGAGQFVWDLSFSALSLSLLEPVGTRAVLSHIIANANFSASPIGVPQAWDAYLSYPNSVGAGEYCFDFIASFIFIKTYLDITGDASFLSTGIHNNHDSKLHTPLEFLRRISRAWEHYPRSAASPWLVDYGDNKRSFLEAVPTCEFENAEEGSDGGEQSSPLNLCCRQIRCPGPPSWECGYDVGTGEPLGIDRPEFDKARGDQS